MLFLRQLLVIQLRFSPALIGSLHFGIGMIRKVIVQKLCGTDNRSNRIKVYFVGLGGRTRHPRCFG